MTQIIEPDTEVGDIAEAAEQVPPDASLYERLGGAYAIAGAVDVLVDRLFANVLVNANTGVHAHHGNDANGPGYKFLVTAWSIEAAGGPKCYLGRDMVAARRPVHRHGRLRRGGDGDRGHPDVPGRART